jgi:hypothetical protein
MKRIYQGWLFAGLAALGPPGVSIAYGQAGAQGVAPSAAPTSPIFGPAAPGYGGSPSPYPQGGTSAFPQGYQPPAAPAAASPQGQIGPYGSVGGRIPYPRKAGSFPSGNQTVSGPTSMASPQGAPAGGYGTYARPGLAPVAAAPGLPAPGGLTSAQVPSGPSGQLGGAPGKGVSPQAGAAGGVPGAGVGAGAPEAGAPGTGEGGAPGAAAPTPPVAATTPPTGAGSAALEEALAGEEAPLAGFAPAATAGAQAVFTPNMIGDLSPLYAHSAITPAPPLPPGPHGSALPYPSLRNFKVSENQSPRPQDRVFFDFNFYSNVNSTVNTAQRSPVNRLNAYTYMWGFEKTFDGGNGSIGMRLPLNSITAQSTTIAAPTSTALGNLDIFAKYILKQNVETGSLISAGFQITPPTATSRFAGAPYLYGLNTTYFQPFIAYLWRKDRFFVQGFSGFDFPANNADVTFMYNDVGLGYLLYQNTDTSRFITMIAPTFEVHVNTPFNHRNPYNTYDPAASAYVTNLTYGLNVMLYGRAMVTTALVTPVSSPKPFDAEFALLLNYFFGRTVRQPTPIIPPVIQ